MNRLNLSIYSCFLLGSISTPLYALSADNSTFKNEVYFSAKAHLESPKTQLEKTLSSKQGLFSQFETLDGKEIVLSERPLKWVSKKQRFEKRAQLLKVNVDFSKDLEAKQIIIIKSKSGAPVIKIKR